MLMCLHTDKQMAAVPSITLLMPVGHVAKPQPCASVGGCLGGLLGGEQRRRGNAEQPRDARSASANLLITHFRT